MYISRTLKSIFGVAVCAGLVSAQLPLHAYDSSYYTAIANQALQAYSSIEEKVPEEKFLEQGLMVNLKKLFKPSEYPFVAPSERSMVESSFVQMPQEDLSTDQNVIDLETVKELDVLRGGTRAHDNFITRITEMNGKSFLSTNLGRKVFIDTITMPVDDISLLKKRQRVIEILVKDKRLREQCFNLLQKMKEAEPYFFHMYTKDGLTDAEKTLYPGPVLNFLRLGEVPAAISFANGVYNTMPIWSEAMLAGGVEGKLKKEKIEPRVARMAGMGAALFYAPFFLPLVGQIKGFLDALKGLQDRLIHVATFVRSGQQLMQLLASHKEIARLMPQLEGELAALTKGEGVSKKFKYLNNLLRKSTFDEGAPSILSSSGNILVAYKYLADKTIRSEYAAIMNQIGALDAYVALAQKIDAHKDMDARFCFANFEMDREEPMIDAVNFWNLFIDPTKVVPNSVSLNTGQERNIIITGPNTGGKSTFMKALMMSILLGQTYGVAPAQSLTFTPFTKLITYLNIADDTGAGISLFKAEVKRASEVMNTLKALPENQFAFVMIDEIFTGTSPDKAEKLSYDFMKKMSEFKNVIFVNATHFKKLTELEQETGGVDKNYHTGVITDDEGRVIKYTYKLVPGPATVSSAQQVVEEGGIEF